VFLLALPSDSESDMVVSSLIQKISTNSQPSNSTRSFCTANGVSDPTSAVRDKKDFTRPHLCIGIVADPAFMQFEQQGMYLVPFAGGVARVRNSAS